MHFCRHVRFFDDLGEFLCRCTEKQNKEEKTSSVALIVFDSLNVNLSSFYPFYVSMDSFYFVDRTDDEETGGKREKGF